MVVFGNEVTKTLCNNLFTFFNEQGKTGKTGKTEIKSKKNHATKNDEKTKNEVTKICNEPSIYQNI